MIWSMAAELRMSFVTELSKKKRKKRKRFQRKLTMTPART
jgi:hypothetical protein